MSLILTGSWSSGDSDNKELLICSCCRSFHSLGVQEVIKNFLEWLTAKLSLTNQEYWTKRWEKVGERKTNKNLFSFFKLLISVKNSFSTHSVATHGSSLMWENSWQERERDREGGKERRRQREREWAPACASWDFTAVCSLALSSYLVWEIIPFLKNWLSFLIFCKGGWQLKDCWTFLRFCTVTCFPSLVFSFPRLTPSATAKGDADFLNSHIEIWTQKLHRTK